MKHSQLCSEYFNLFLKDSENSGKEKNWVRVLCENYCFLHLECTRKYNLAHFLLSTLVSRNMLRIHSLWECTGYIQ